jgi:two-component system, NarL family, sensor kinase
MEQAEGIENLQILFVGTIGMMILSAAIILFVIYYQKRKLAEQEERRKLLEANQERVLAAILETQENERRRIARDLHDEVGSTLSIAKMNVGHISRYVTDRDDHDMAQDTYSILDETLKNVRRISKDLHPVVLEKYGLIEAVAALGRKCTSEDMEVIINNNGVTGRLLQSQELNIFRIIQELLSNALKHAQASEVVLDFEWQPGSRFSVRYNDNGIGFTKAVTGAIKAEEIGIGMVTIETRVRMLKGTWNLQSQPGMGTTAFFSFPVEKV